MQFKGTHAVPGSTQYSCSTSAGTELIRTHELPHQSNHRPQVGDLHRILPKTFSQMWEEKELTLERHPNEANSRELILIEQ